jgi:predicted small secreted protein
MKRALILLLPLLLAACETAPGTGIDARGGVMASIAPGPVTLASIVDAAPAAVSSRLGAPDFRRSEPHAEVWQYSGGNCSLFVYFYETASGALGARHVDARKLEGGAADKTACLSAVMARRNAPMS